MYNVLKTEQLVLLVAEDTGYKTDLVQNAIQQYKDVFYVIHQEQSAHSAMKDSTKKESHVSPAPISKTAYNATDHITAQNVFQHTILRPESVYNALTSPNAYNALTKTPAHLAKQVFTPKTEPAQTVKPK